MPLLNIVGCVQLLWDQSKRLCAAAADLIKRAVCSLNSWFSVLWLVCVASMTVLLVPLYWAQQPSVISQARNATSYCQYIPPAWSTTSNQVPVVPTAGTPLGTREDVPGFSNDTSTVRDNIMNVIPEQFKLRATNSGREVDMLEINCRFMAVDLSSRKAALLCVMGFWGGLSKPPTYTGLQLSPNQSLVVDYAPYTAVFLGDGAHPTPQELPLLLGSSRDQLDGSIWMYPHTNLSWELLVSAYTTNNTSGILISSVPMTSSMSAYQLPLFQLEVKCVVNTDISEGHVCPAQCLRDNRTGQLFGAIATWHAGSHVGHGRIGICDHCVVDIF